LKRIWLILTVLTACSFAASAQIRWWGIYDFEVQKGGSDSRSDLNGLLNNDIQLSARQFQLFLDADINKTISLSAMIVNSPSKPFELKGIELQLANVTFNHLLGDALSISAGKIFTPFGSFTKRQLAPDNPLIGKPLFYTYPLNISPFMGYLDSAGSAAAVGVFGARVSSVYPGGYYVGAEAFGSFFDGTLEYGVAVMNAPLSSTTVDNNVDANLALHGRVAVHPAIWSTIGVSYAVGSYMQDAPTNLVFKNAHGSLDQFVQTTYGVDLLLSYLYYELNAEYIFNRFDAPYVLSQGGDASGNGYTGRLSQNLDSREYFVDLKIDAPFYPGLFVAFRYDKLVSSSIRDPYRRSSTFSTSIPWNGDVGRYAIGVGYKPDHSVLIKLGYETTDVDVTPKPNLEVAALAIVVTF
jgi:hypothetical protein